MRTIGTLSFQASIQVDSSAFCRSTRHHVWPNSFLTNYGIKISSRYKCFFGSSMQRDLDDLSKWADRVKLFGTRESYRVGSLRSADVFPVVASHPPQKGRAALLNGVVKRRPEIRVRFARYRVGCFIRKYKETGRREGKKRNSQSYT